MPYTYDHEVIEILDETQRGLLNLLFQSTWTGPPQNVVSAMIRVQAGNAKIIEVTGTKDLANEALLPDPPFELVDTDGSIFTVQLTERGQLNPGQVTALNNFIASVWPGSVGDVRQLDFLKTDFGMRATLLGEMSAATADDLPKGKRYRVKTKS